MKWVMAIMLFPLGWWYRLVDGTQLSWVHEIGHALIAFFFYGGVNHIQRDYTVGYVGGSGFVWPFHAGGVIGETVIFTTLFMVALKYGKVWGFFFFGALHGIFYRVLILPEFGDMQGKLSYHMSFILIIAIGLIVGYIYLFSKGKEFEESLYKKKSVMYYK